MRQSADQLLSLGCHVYKPNAEDTERRDGRRPNMQAQAVSKCNMMARLGVKQSPTTPVRD